MASKDDTLEAIGKEIKERPPSILRATRRKFGVARAEAQRKAILLSKARAAGVKIPKPPSMTSGGGKSGGS